MSLLLPFLKAFALYRFAVISVGIADRVRSRSAIDANADALAWLAGRFAQREREISGGRDHS